jgi:hypothetical protein
MSGFLLLLLVAMIAGGIGYMLGRRAAERQHMMYSAAPGPLPKHDGPQEYYRPYNNDGPGYYSPRQGYMQQQGYPQQQSQGMNPLVAGGLGAAAGGLVGYGLGQAMAEDGSEGGDAAPAEDSFSDIGDFGGGDW